MIKIEKARVYNFEGAFRGLRNPLDSWDKSDSVFGIATSLEDINEDFKKVYLSYHDYSTGINAEIYSWLISQGVENPALNKSKNCQEYALLGNKDLDLARRMIAGGTDESKFMRQIMVSFDLTAPFYMWKEFDTYKVGTVSNSCSTMHRLSKTEITEDCFSRDLINITDYWPIPFFEETSISPYTIKICEELRRKFNETGDKAYWRALIQNLPDSWLQKRTITLNYQVLRAMYFARRNHKLQEWRDFCVWIETLPYALELICYEKKRVVMYKEIPNLEALAEIFDISVKNPNNTPKTAEQIINEIIEIKENEDDTSKGNS